MENSSLRSELDNCLTENSELQSRVDELSDFIENAALPLHWVDAEGKVIWANQAELDALGYNKEEYIGKPITEFHADQDVIDDILKRLTSKETLINYEARLKCKDGSIKDVLINSNALFKDGKFIHTRCFTRDITDIKKEEKKRIELLKELEAANKELIEFSYIISHDLKSPIRAISNLSDIVLIDNKDLLNDESKSNLRTIKSRAIRMLQMLNTIVTYSKIGDVAISPEKVDLNKLVDEILEGINPPECIQIKMEAPLPVLTGYKLPIEQVFHNILENAVMFNNKSKGEIEIGAIDEGSKWKFYIKDNGPGIAPEHREKVFRVFQTLQSRDDIESTGIGLSIVQKIIKSFKGEVWIESEPDKYTTFYFTLPKNLNESAPRPVTTA